MEILEIPLATLETTPVLVTLETMPVSATLETIHAMWVTLETTHEAPQERQEPPVLQEPQERQLPRKRNPQPLHNQRNKPLRL